MPFDESSSPRRGRRPPKNVLGGPLELCSTTPLTGFFRNGCCETGPEDVGSHTVCVVLTAEFLAFSKDIGNDLSTPRPGGPVVPLRAALAGSVGEQCRPARGHAIDRGSGATLLRFGRSHPARHRSGIIQGSAIARPRTATPPFKTASYDR